MFAMAFPSTMLLCIVVLLATTSAYNADLVVVEIPQEWDHGSSTSGSSRPETAFGGASSLLRPSILPGSRPRYNADSKMVEIAPEPRQMAEVAQDWSQASSTYGSSNPGTERVNVVEIVEIWDHGTPSFGSRPSSSPLPSSTTSSPLRYPTTSSPLLFRTTSSPLPSSTTI